MKKESGLSLIEAAIVLALSAAVVSGVLYYYFSSKENNAVLETTKGVQSIIAATQSLYGSRGHTAGSNISAGAVSAVSGIEIGSPKIIRGQKSVFYLPGHIAEASFFVYSKTKNTVLTVHTASKSACMSLAMLNFGTMVEGGVKVNVTNKAEVTGNGQYQGGTTITNPAIASSVCKEATDNKVARIMYQLKIQ
ncbi:TPA: type II secretion system protein [Escherichia coli]|nr:type II secretion system protein [Escherichia coli]